MSNYYKDGELIQPPDKIIRDLQKKNRSNFFYQRLGLEPVELDFIELDLPKGYNLSLASLIKED